MKKQEEGIITVYLSLILLLILSIIFTTIEVARVNGFKTLTNRTMKTAMDSVLGDFYLPLFEEYHIFALDGGYGDSSMNTASIKEAMKEYMEYTFYPSKDLDNFGLYLSHMNLYGVKINKVEVSMLTTLIDYEGSLFIKQANNYMKYKELGNVIEKVLSYLSIIEDKDDISHAFSKKQVVDESVAVLEKEILKLMSYVDGLALDESGFIVQNNGDIKIKDGFVKKICPYPITNSNVKINNPWLYDLLKSKYVNPLIVLEEVESYITSYKEYCGLREDASVEHLILSLVDKSVIEDEEELERLDRDLIVLERQIEYYDELINETYNGINIELHKLRKLLSSSIEAILDAIRLINNIAKEKDMVERVLEDYKLYLDTSKELIGDDIYKALLDEYNLLGKYRDQDSFDFYNLEGMKETLNNNLNLLQSISSILNLSFDNNYESISALLDSIASIKFSFQKYSFHNLEFDYSNFNKPKDSKELFDGIRSFLQSGLLGIVVQDSNQLSDKTLTSKNLPSSYINKEEISLDSILDMVVNNLGLDSSLANNIFQSISSIDISFIDSIYSNVLFEEYLQEHFNSYLKVKNNLDKKLEYELEYILVGEKEDKENLGQVVATLLLLRTFTNFITVFCDKSLNLEAGTYASALVGFTGIPALISIVKMILLFLFSIVESLIDIAALLKDKNIPIIKGKSELSLTFKDLFLINKDLIHKKADKLSDEEKINNMNYNSFLRIIGYTKSQKNKGYRAMDLIEENIKLNYEESFYIKNSIQSIEASGEFQMESKFINFEFIRNSIKKSGPYQYTISNECTY